MWSKSYHLSKNTSLIFLRGFGALKHPWLKAQQEKRKRSVLSAFTHTRLGREGAIRTNTGGDRKSWPEELME